MITSTDNMPDNIILDARGVADARGTFLRFGPQSGNLASVVRGIKSAVTKYANEHNIPFAWQSRFHDHIIRNQLEMNRIARYIQNNPMKWELDRFYKKRWINQLWTVLFQFHHEKNILNPP